MAKTRYRTATVVIPGGAEAILVAPDQDLPEGVSDSDLNPKVFTPWTETDMEGFTNYEDMKVPALMRMAKDRNLSPDSHKKADLVAALEEDDASNA